MTATRHVAVLVVTLVLLIAAGPAWAQPAPPPGDTPTSAWTWSGELSAFAGFNYQRREFFDFDAWESQNWLMGALERRGPRTGVRVLAMLTAEPFTIGGIGSPQAFQTGETYRNAPIIDYQHPHDLVMQLAADVTRRAGPLALGLTAALVGTPAIGPPPFMHRPSGTENPQSPLGHHYLDSTHVTPGVVTGSLRRGPIGLEVSAFHGREPDERRTDLDLGRLDSSAVRLSWTRAGWMAQVSGAWLTRPERLSPYDATKRSASVAHEFALGGGVLSWTAAAGQNREAFGHLEAYLLEATWRPARWAIYGRAERVDKDILDAGFHPIGVGHRHRQSPVGALTLGATRDVVTRRWGTLGLGGDVTGYHVPTNLREAYGAPLSFHGFVRYRARAGAGAMAHHQH